MLALKLTDKKDFMNRLLRTPLFDNFLLQEGTVNAKAAFTVDGTINRDFYTKEDLEELGLEGYRFLPFSMLRGNFFDLIKGKKTPAAFKFVFLLSPENLAKTLACISGYTTGDVTGVFLNIRYQNGLLSLTTGVSCRIFSTDKTLENEWDRMVKQFLKQHEISFEEL